MEPLLFLAVIAIILLLLSCPLVWSALNSLDTNPIKAACLLELVLIMLVIAMIAVIVIAVIVVMT